MRLRVFSAPAVDLPCEDLVVSGGLAPHYMDDSWDGAWAPLWSFRKGKGKDLNDSSMEACIVETHPI